MIKKIFFYSCLLLFFFTFSSFSKKEKSPDLMLAKIYADNIDVTQYWVSEKLDGVRAHWDGKQLISRGGKVFDTPIWFTALFPKETLDGELWAANKKYEDIFSIVSRDKPHKGWQEIAFWIFDAPQNSGNFDARLKQMRKIIKTNRSAYLKLIQQNQVSDESQLMRQLKNTIDRGGEGLMLHKKTALYKKGRSNDLLKLKPYTDAEATVLGYKEGKGKFSKMVGSLKVQGDDGIVFYIGSGLSDAQRKNPPQVGSRVTFRYQGFTKKGIPRFPVFLHIRGEE